MSRSIAFFFLLFIISTNSSAHYDFNENLQRAYSEILNLHFKEADAKLSQEKISNPGNSLTILYQNYIDFLKAFISEEPALFETLKNNTTHRLEALEKDKSNESSPFHLYVQAEIHIQQALVRIKFEENILSAGEIRKAYKLIEKNKELFPAFILNDKVAGFLHAVVGAVPQKYSWLVKMAGMTGNIQQGLSELQLCYEKCSGTNYSLYQTEILFYLGNIYSVFNMSTVSVPLLNQMEELIASPLIAYVYSNILMKKGKNDEALVALNEGIKNAAYPFNFLYYKRGLCRLRKMEMNSGEDFNYYLNHYKGSNSIKSAYQKLAWIYLLENDTLNYRNTINKCLNNGKALLDEDKDAYVEAKNGEIPNTHLLKSRLYFDGGYYKNASAELSGKPISEFKRFRDQLEVTYRLARIMQMSGMLDKAIKYYEVTITNGSSTKYYFAANSSLQLGLIYEEKKEYEKALSYFNKCLTMETDQYKNSIDQKAKAGIERIKNSKK